MIINDIILLRNNILLTVFLSVTRAGKQQSEVDSKPVWANNCNIMNMYRGWKIF